MYSRFSAAVRFALPPKKFDLERLPSYHAFQRGNLRFVLSQKISSSGVIFKGPRFVLGHPDADQIAGEIVTLRQRMQSLACNVFLSDLTLEFDAVGVVLGHGFHPWKARRPRSIPNPRPVHRQGRTPISGQACTASEGGGTARLPSPKRARSMRTVSAKLRASHVTGPSITKKVKTVIATAASARWP